MDFEDSVYLNYWEGTSTKGHEVKERMERVTSDLGTKDVLSIYIKTHYQELPFRCTIDVYLLWFYLVKLLRWLKNILKSVILKKLLIFVFMRWFCKWKNTLRTHSVLYRGLTLTDKSPKPKKVTFGRINCCKR